MLAHHPGTPPAQARWKDVYLSCELDSIVAIKYAMVANSRSIKMSKIGTRFFDWQHQLQISCRHIRGIHNGRADALSRQEWSASDWHLNPHLLRRVLRHWGCAAEIDIFASRQNTQSQQYFSWDHDSQWIACHTHDHGERRSTRTPRKQSSLAYCKRLSPSSYTTWCWLHRASHRPLGGLHYSSSALPHRWYCRAARGPLRTLQALHRGTKDGH
jgi:hypothetical protein